MSRGSRAYSYTRKKRDKTISRVLFCVQSPNVDTLAVEELNNLAELWRVMMQQFHVDAKISLNYAKLVPGARPVQSTHHCSLWSLYVLAVQC